MDTSFSVYMDNAYCAVQRDGLAGIYNGSDTDLYVRSIRWHSPGAVGQQSIGHNWSGPLNVVRTSAATGGTVVDLVKHDTVAADLPAGVELRVLPTSLTTTSLIRRHLFVPQIGRASPLTYEQPPLQRYGPSRFVARGPRQGELFSTYSAGTSAPVVLRPGQGIGIVSADYIYSVILEIAITVRNVSTGDTYFYRTAEVPCAFGSNAYPLFNFHNGSAADVYEVTDLSLNFQTDGAYPSHGPTGLLGRISYIDGYIGGTEVTPVAHDSDTAAIPSEVKFLKGPFRTYLLGEKAGPVWPRWCEQSPFAMVFTTSANVGLEQSFSIGAIADAIHAPFTVLPGAAGGLTHPPPSPSNRGDVLIDFENSSSPLVVPPGMGIAIIQNRNARWWQVNYKSDGLWTLPNAVMDVEFVVSYAPAEDPSSSNLTTTFGWG